MQSQIDDQRGGCVQRLCPQMVGYRYTNLAVGYREDATSMKLEGQSGLCWNKQNASSAFVSAYVGMIMTIIKGEWDERGDLIHYSDQQECWFEKLRRRKASHAISGCCVILYLAAFDNGKTPHIRHHNNLRSVTWYLEIQDNYYPTILTSEMLMGKSLKLWWWISCPRMIGELDPIGATSQVAGDKHVNDLCLTTVPPTGTTPERHLTDIDGDKCRKKGKILWYIFGTLSHLTKRVRAEGEFVHQNRNKNRKRKIDEEVESTHTAIHRIKRGITAQSRSNRLSFSRFSFLPSECLSKGRAAWGPIPMTINSSCNTVKKNPI